MRGSTISSCVMDGGKALAGARGQPRERLGFAVAVTALQALAGIFFVIDSLIDTQLEPAGAGAAMSWLEAGIALALLAGVALGARLTRQMLRQARERERVIALARGAVAEFIAGRFAEWGLSAAESDVALFALKGCTIAEIAGLRRSAEGTVRAQLSQVYAKAGVSTQSMLIALVFEELV